MPPQCRTNPEDRICKYCSIGCEDEKHFLLLCPLYNEIRSQMFNTIEIRYPFFKSYDQDQKFVWIMGNLDPIIIKSLSTYIVNAFNKRKMSQVDISLSR